MARMASSAGRYKNRGPGKTKVTNGLACLAKMFLLLQLHLRYCLETWTVFHSLAPQKIMLDPRIATVFSADHKLSPRLLNQIKEEKNNILSGTPLAGEGRWVRELGGWVCMYVYLQAMIKQIQTPINSWYFILII